MSSIKVAIAHLGARKHYQEPILFYQWGILERFYTDFYAGDHPVIQRLRNSRIQLPGVLKRAIERCDPKLKGAPVTHFPDLAYRYNQALRKSSTQQIYHQFNWSGKEFCERILRKGLGDATTVYGFPVSSKELFEYAKQEGLRCILDQTIAERALTFQLLLEEEARWKDWSTEPFVLNQAAQELIDREHQEQDLADHIVCGSPFVKDSLVKRGIKPEQVSVIALGRMKEQSGQKSRYRSSAKSRGDALKILFAGTVSLRKGIPDLLNALKQLKGVLPFSCKIAGSIEIRPERLADYQDVCEFLGRVPRSQMQQLYEEADVFVLPSICEGSAMVTYEALLMGLPVITTYNAGSLVRDGIDGHIVPIRDSSAIAEKLIQVYESGDRGIDSDDRRAYLQKRFEGYEAELSTIVHTL